MLAIKKKQQAEAEAAAAAAAAAAAVSSGSSPDAPAAEATATDSKDGGAAAAPKQKIFGIGRPAASGGDDAAASTGRKRSPGEIRLQKDVAELDAGKVAEVSWPDKEDLTSMVVNITPDAGLWRGGTFKFTIKVPNMYPHEPPKVHCETKIYHPNIDYAGHVCLNILRDDWKPIFTINTVIYGMIYLFHEPNPDDPLNHQAAACLRENRAQFERNVYRSMRGYEVDGERFDALLRG